MKQRLLHFLKVDERPAPPPGSEGTLDVFHPSRRFFHYSVIGWAWKQFLTLVGIVLPLVFLSGFSRRWVEVASRVVDRVGFVPINPEVLIDSLMITIESFAVVFFVVQLIVSGLLLDLAWQMRWYMVSEESLRIREGLVRVREQTMRIANIQNIVVRQGPLQRLFGIADLEVYTAGGGSGGQGDQAAKDSSAKNKGGHVGRFRGLADAGALRDRLQRALSRHRDAGLGDRREVAIRRRRRVAPAAVDPSVGPALDELLGEARALRGQLEAAPATRPS